jgi:hypothetical protein
MILSTYYRQNHYHPVYAMRSTFGLLIQIPFFIAAYSYLSHLETLQGTSFLMIRDLGKPDALLSLSGGGVYNLLPILMTVINCVSSAVYTKDFPLKDKIQLYGIAAVFLVLLYNSPAGLVLYWTLNNVFSLLKNVLLKTKYAKKIIFGVLCLFSLALDIYFIQKGLSPKRLFVVLLFSLVFFAPLFIRLFKAVKQKIRARISPENTVLAQKRVFFSSILILFLLSGLVIPASLIASSVQEFSFLENYTSPFPFILYVMSQSVGIYLFWFLCVYFLCGKRARYGITFFASLAAVITFADTFIFPGDFGFLTTTFRFSMPDTLESQYTLILVSTIAFLAILAIFSFLLLSRKKFFFQSFQMIALISLSTLGAIKVFQIKQDFSEFARMKENSNALTETFKPVYTFSENGKNVLIIMLDRAISGYVPYIFEEKPELYAAFDGFTYYPNCIAFGSHTRVGAPALFGGYEYVPSIIHANRETALKKHNEALLMMPKLFSDHQFMTTVTDPSFANYSLKPDLSIYTPYPEIHAENIVGKYAGEWIKEHPDIKIVSIPTLLQQLLIRFSFFKMAPPVFRIFIYDKGEWLSDENETGDESTGRLSLDTIDNYTALDFLPKITGFTTEKCDTYTALVNDITHNPAFFQAPDYVPSAEVYDRGKSPFADEDHYHVNMAAFLMLAKWFDTLKTHQTYDNTRIIIVSDHGKGLNSKFPGNIILPNGDCLESYQSLLLVKDFNDTGILRTDMTFMTHADVPLIATNSLIKNPVNPFTGIPIESKKEGGVTITTMSVLNFTINPNEWLYVHDNIFDEKNWERVEK